MKEVDVELEKYTFHRKYLDDLATARKSLDLLDQYGGTGRKVTGDHAAVLFPLIRDVTVSYARPFTKSEGPSIRYMLKAEDWVSPAYHALHRRLMNMRHHQFSHSDLRKNQPSYGILPMGDKSWHIVLWKPTNYPYLWFNRKKIRALVEAVADKLSEAKTAFEQSRNRKSEGVVEFDPMQDIRRLKLVRKKRPKKKKTP